jgi:hypothetical protein
VREIAENKSRDEVLKHFSDIAWRLENRRYWASHVNTAQFEKLKRGEVKRLNVHSVLQPRLFRGFASVFMAGANFTDSLIYQLWTECGVEFDKDAEFTKGLRFQKRENGQLIKIRYATETPWSRQQHNARNTRNTMAQPPWT